MISGVGGQYNFIAMSHELNNARSIINCRSTYNNDRTVESNIVWEYGTTIPRHLRDIVVTEYGIGDCRSKTDAEVIKILLNITDSRFQKNLLKQAKKHKKIPNDYQIPEEYKNNYPQTILDKIKTFEDKSFYYNYPFSNELTSEEIKLKHALTYLKTCSFLKIITLLLNGIVLSNKRYKKLLERMQLDKPKNVKEYLYCCILKSSINHLLKK